MKGKTISELRVGQSDRLAKTISESDVYLYAGITGDMNPAHVNEAYAKETFFKGRIAHGMLVSGLISAVIGTRLPGPGTIYLQQTLNFLAPVPFGETVTAEVEVSEIVADEKRVKLKTVCRKQDGTVVIEGEALVSPPR